MTNSITFSPDMTLLYLIDDGRAIPFAIDKRGGVLVTVLRGQLTVVSAPFIDPQTEEAEMKPEDKAEIRSISAPEQLPPFPQKLSIPVQNNQWTLFFDPGNQVLGIIGVTDIEAGIKQERKPTSSFSLFPLKEHIIDIRRIEGRLNFLSIPF
jgi:hypothetical protein